MAVIRQSQFLNMVGNNKRVKRLLARREQGAYAIDTEKLTTELETMHGTRVFRSYQTKQVLQDAQAKLVRASIQEAGFRSRAVAIRMDCFRVSELLDEELGNIGRYLGTRYADLLAQEFKTVEARKDAIKHVLQELYTLLHKLRTVMKTADMVIEDIDKTSYSIKSVLDAMAMSFRTEKNI